MTEMNLDSRLNLAYPDGAPEQITKLLKGELTGFSADAKDALAKIASASEENDRIKHQNDARKREIEQLLPQREREFNDARGRVERSDFITWPDDLLIPAYSKFLALQLVVERIKTELSERNAQQEILEDAGRNWIALRQLAECRIKNQIPDEKLAAEFGSTPEQMVTPVRWQQHLSEIERARRDAEMAPALAAAKAEADRREAAAKVERDRIAAETAAREAKEKLESARQEAAQRRAQLEAEAREAQAKLERDLAEVERAGIKTLIALVEGGNPHDFLFKFFSGDMSEGQHSVTYLRQKRASMPHDPIRHRALERLTKIAEEMYPMQDKPTPYSATLAERVEAVRKRR